MKKLKYLIFILATSMMSLTCFPQITTITEVSLLPNRVIQMIIDQQGHWGKNDTAIAGPVNELFYNGRQIGYYCNVQPSGFIVFSLRKELAPVKAWSDRNHFNAEAKEGIEEVIKSCMTRLIDTIESRFGPIDYVHKTEIEMLAEIDYIPVWTSIKNYIDGTLQQKERSSGNYQDGDTLINSNWHQNAPYNSDCPYNQCSNTINGCMLVGCVATAGAQIMRYWCWPPNDYDWVNMADVVTTASPQAQQEAVAALCHDVGVAVDMDYGCTISSSYTSDMVDVFVDDFGYNSSCTVKHRDDYTAGDWFDLIKFNLNRNRPTQYRIPGHSIVCDGWRLDGLHQTKQYHMNYGWQSLNHDAWYTLDALQGGNIDEEYIIHRTYPAPSLGWSLAGTYMPIPIYKYFDQDAAGSSATFMSGHKLQTLPGIKIIGSSNAGYVKFYGSTGNATKIFTRGDQSIGIKIQNGGLRLSNNGVIRLQ